ncbi:trypsin-1-like [Culicoides brevitarsis]|uniref:trypsin-1-like n=1 Tax=Culicoides brevitarsis TaxID=469753 RepID=UPI00307BA14C
MKGFLVFALFVASVAALPQKFHIGYNGGRIVGGENAQRGEFPFIISLRWSVLGVEQHVCGGSIIDEMHVLTAGHCITELPLAGTMHVIAGMTDMKNTGGVEKWQKIKVVERIVHEDYHGGVNPNDIAVLKLEEPLQFNEFVQPIDLPHRGSDVDGQVTLAGWGSTSSSIIVPSMPSDLQRINLPIVPIVECDEAMTSLVGPSPLDYTSNICTGPLTGGISACSGDSGGPLVQKTSSGYEQVGIVSWGIVPCGSVGAPSVYTKVSAFTDWVASKMN